jgi:hypothetical protein
MDKQSNKSGVQRDWQGKLTGCQYVFNGINNIIDPLNLNIDEGDVVDGINVVFDNTKSVARRTGYATVYSGDYHSGWSNDNKTLAYMVSGTNVYEYDGTSAPYIVYTGLTSTNRMEFCQVNDVVAFSNGVDFGIIGGNYTQISTYSPEFKRTTTGGRCLEFYNGRLYFSKYNTLYCTDTFDVERVDIRFTEVATFQHNITMCKRVEDGLWVGTEKYVYFLRGDDVRESGFEQIIAAKAGVVYGTACKTNAEYLPDSQNVNNVVIFLTSQGICSGGNGGKYLNHSFNEVSFDTGTTGTATIKYERGTSVYVVTFDVDSQYEYNLYNSGIPVEVNER